MGMEGSRAVAVGLYDGRVQALDKALADCGYALAGLAPDGATGLGLLQALQPRLALVNAALPGMDGVDFAKRVRALRLVVQPDILLLAPPGLRLPERDSLPALGVVALESPVDADRLKAVLNALCKRPRALPEDKAARLNSLLDALGVPLHRGRDCLCLAVALAWHDAGRVASLKNGIYPEVARQTGLTVAQVERAVRHAIDAAWRNGAIEHQHRIFGDTIDARRGKPTCGEMIAQLAEELRWEA